MKNIINSSSLKGTCLPEVYADQLVRQVLRGAVLLLALAMSITISAQTKTLNAADFGAIPDDGRNDQQALQSAVDACRKAPGTTLIIPPGVYDIIDADAVKLMNDIMNWKMGRNPQDVIYTPYYPYSKGIDLTGLKDVTIKADGATLLCTGWMEPVSIIDAENVTIEGLTIDYKTIPHSEGKVVKVDKKYIDVELSNTEWLRDKMLITRIMFWNLNRDRLLAEPVYFPKDTKKIDDKTIRIFFRTKPGMLGTIALMDHTFHFRPALLILGSKNTVLDRITIYSQPGMGIVGHRSEDILMTGLRVVPGPGRYQSTNTDATHFTSCQGTIRFDGCMFEGQGDDATNVHGYYHKFTKDLGNNTYNIKLEERWCTHAAVLDFPDVGDTVEIVKKSSLEVITKMIVLKVDTFPKEWRSEVTFDRPLPGNKDDFYFIDVTQLPALEFVNSYVGSHLARGVLVKTRNVLIENCTFRDGTGTAIHIGAEGDWREGAGSENVTIRNNRMIRTGRGAGRQDGACAIALNVKAPNNKVPGIHKNIIIDGNIIIGEDAPVGISIQGADNVNLTENVITGCRKDVGVKYSTNVEILESKK